MLPAAIMNAIEKAAVAKSMADYIIDHLLVDEPMSARELESLAVDIIEDRGIKDAEEFESITALAVSYVSNDPRAVVAPKGELDNRVLWFTHKTSC